MTLSTHRGIISDFPVIEPGSRDYIGSGELGPIQHVSGCRMMRGSVYGVLYVGAEEFPQWDTISKPLSDAVAFMLVPYERNLSAPELQARGASGCVLVPRFSRYGERNDYELWNVAAASLQHASDLVTRTYNTCRPHIERGAWTVSYVGTTGKDTVWAQAKSLSARLISVTTQGPAHFVAKHKSGTAYRVIVRWDKVPESAYWECLSLQVSPYLLSGEHRSIPKYVTDWILSRCQ